MINLKELLKDHQTGHSEFQDDYLITNRAGGTVYGCYKQSLRELYKRFRGLRELICDKEILALEIQELKGSTGKNAIEYKRKSMQMEESNRVLEDTKREFLRFYQQAIYLKEQIGELTKEKRRKLDQEMWEFKLKEMAVFDFAVHGRLSENTFSFLHSCPSKLKLSLIKELSNSRKLMLWYENKEDILTPEEFPRIKFDPTLLENLI